MSLTLVASGEYLMSGLAWLAGCRLHEVFCGKCRAATGLEGKLHLATGSVCTCSSPPPRLGAGQNRRVDLYDAMAPRGGRRGPPPASPPPFPTLGLPELKGRPADEAVSCLRTDAASTFHGRLTGLRCTPTLRSGCDCQASIRPRPCGGYPQQGPLSERYNPYRFSGCWVSVGGYR